jgi:hypothetical protein
MKRALVPLLLLLIRCACPCDEARVAAPVKSTRVAAAASTPMPSSRIDVSAPAPRIARSQRNLFAYYEPPRQPIALVATPPPIVLPSTPPPTLPSTPDPPRAPHFPYRFIGRFGPEHDPIAAFTRDGDVRTLRAGDRIDEQFVLRAIRFESVEVEARGWNEVIRAPLQQQ